MCNSANKTPSAVALESGLSKTSVTRWKKGGGISDVTMCRIADYFGISVECLLGEPNYCSVQETEVHEKNVKQRYQCLSESGQAIVDRFVESLLSEGNKQLIEQMVDSLLDAEGKN